MKKSTFTKDSLMFNSNTITIDIINCSLNENKIIPMVSCKILCIVYYFLHNTEL